MTIATQHTLEFVKSYLPEKNGKILEVGCGKGHLAVELQNLGVQVTAIDINPEAVRLAQEKGGAAETASILDFETTDSFDIVLFTSSLHHIHPLDKVLDKVKALLQETGRLLVDDFALEQMDLRTASWFYDLDEIVRTLAGGDAGTSVTENPLEKWKKEHLHEPPLHTSKDVLKAMEKNFGNFHSMTAPYLYRYFASNLEKFPNGKAALQKIYDLENKLIAAEFLKPIGFRIVAKKYFSYLK